MHGALTVHVTWECLFIFMCLFSFPCVRVCCQNNAVWSYVGNLANTNLNRTDASIVLPETIATDAQRMIWPDTVAFRQDGTLLVSSNQLNFFLDGSMNFDTPVNGMHNFRLETILSPILAPRFAYNSLPKNADVFQIWHNPQNPCEGTPSNIHVVSNREQCLYTMPHPAHPNGAWFQMQCGFNFTTGQTVASFQAYDGPGCTGTPYRQGSVHGDDATCLPFGADPITGQLASVTASCFNEPAEKKMPPAGSHTYISHGHVDTCARGPTAIHTVADGVCTEIINDGHFLRVTCDSDRVARFATFRGSDCAMDSVMTWGIGLGDGVSCLPFTSPYDSSIILGSVAVLCGSVPAPSNGGEGGESHSGVKPGIAALLFFIGLAVGLLATYFFLKWRMNNNQQSHSGYQQNMLG